MKTVRIRVNGKVQGVFYRASARDKAEELQLNGWVANREDGSVEALASGDAAAVDAFIAWCRQGPEKAEVISVEVEEAPHWKAAGFVIRRG